jgi:nucleotide-binding universal stress UspA family protein
MKTLLVPFYDDAPAEAALEVASRVASRFGSHIEGLFVVRPPQIIDGEGIALADSYVTQLKEEGRRLAVRASERYHRSVERLGIPLRGLSAASEGGPSAGWLELHGLEGQIIGDHGRLFDLILVGRDFGQPWLDWNVMCEAALFESGRPVLVAPARAPEAFGETVAVAWNGSTETARAVALSMPVLARATRVLVFDTEGWTHHGPPSEELTAHLRRGGIAAETHRMALEGRSPGEAILTECTKVEADLLVKGAYTQSRLRQLVFGGATRHILSQAQIPVLFAH